MKFTTDSGEVNATKSALLGVLQLLLLHICTMVFVDVIASEAKMREEGLPNWFLSHVVRRNQAIRMAPHLRVLTFRRARVLVRAASTQGPRCLRWLLRSISGIIELPPELARAPRGSAFVQNPARSRQFCYFQIKWPDLETRSADSLPKFRLDSKPPHTTNIRFDSIRLFAELTVSALTWVMHLEMSLSGDVGGRAWDPEARRMRLLVVKSRHIDAVVLQIGG